jgi:hypothetical protein
VVVVGLVAVEDAELLLEIEYIAQDVEAEVEAEVEVEVEVAYAVHLDSPAHRNWDLLLVSYI